ncbi:3'-5' exoribonuclease [Clostridiales Family XIII bacterium PM5-7]
MKDFYVADLRHASEITDFYMVKTVGIKVGANKKQYLDITLGDKTGEVSSKKWDIDSELDLLSAIKEGDIVKVKAQVTDWQGQVQLRISRIRLSNEEDDLDITDYIKSAPEASEEMYQYIYSVAEGFQDADLKALCTKVLADNYEKLLYYPAASKNHHAEYGGLLYHVKRMLMTGLHICQVYPNLNQDLVCAGVILHDIEKLNEIESNTYGISSGYSFEGQMLGHIVQGIKYLDRMTTALNFPREKALMLEHMILSHHYEPEFGSPKKPLFPEAELLHYLDILDARMFDMEDALANTEPGGFSERVWTLDNRRLYKPLDKE